MNLLSLVPDNMTDVLLKILRFAELRHHVLYYNLQRGQDAGFQPKDMPVDEFAAVLEDAVAQHLQSHRLVFRDTGNVRFGLNGSMEVQAVTDTQAETLLHTDLNAYIRYQKQLCRENALNHLVAQELLELTCGPRARAIRLHEGLAAAGPDRLEQSWNPRENVD